MTASTANKSANLSRSVSWGKLGRYSGEKRPIRALQATERMRALEMPVTYPDKSQESRPAVAFSGMLEFDFCHPSQEVL